MQGNDEKRRSKGYYDPNMDEPFFKIIIFYAVMAGGFQVIDQFYGATYLLKMSEQGLSLFNISLILGILDLANAIVDYPSGVISDYIWKKEDCRDSFDNIWRRTFGVYIGRQSCCIDSVFDYNGCRTGVIQWISSSLVLRYHG